MRLNNFIEGLTILQKYYDKSDGYHTGAEHDQFYAYSTHRPLTPEDYLRMVSLEWFQPDASEKVYDPEAGWSAWT